MDVAKFVVEQIEEATGTRTEPPREYIGGSSIGHECDANVAYGLRGYPVEFKARFLRIFDLGKHIEDVLVDILRRTDIIVYAVDPDTDGQWTWEDMGGHIKAHADGVLVIDGQRFLLECKSMKDSEFQKTKKRGLKDTHPEYYEQCQMMMGMSNKLGSGRLCDNLLKTVFVFYDKDNSDVWAEVVDYDPFRYAYQCVRSANIMTQRPVRISDDPEFFRCRMCSRKPFCHGGEVYKKTCTTCRYAYARADGLWACAHSVGGSVSSPFDDSHPECIEPCEHYEHFKPEAKNA
jgi:hypothetical protein